MNKDGFQKKKSRNRGGSSTKEIARAAVEEEFQKHRNGKRRRQDDHDYLSDSDDEGGRKKKKQEVLFRPSQVKMAPKTNDDEQTYRDRAKERREGGTTSHPNESPDDPQMSSAGLVKGLDLSMVRKERTQLKGDDGGDSISFVVEKESSANLPSFEEARADLEHFVHNPAPSFPEELSEFVVRFVRAKFSMPDSSRRMTTRAEGRALHRTRLVLRPHTHILDRARAWEAPREINRAGAPDLRYVPPLSEAVLGYVNRLFPDRSSKMDKVTSESAPIEDSQTTTTGQASSQQEAQTVSNGFAFDGTSNDDDDDIFGGLDDYDPPKAS
jgi:hypothetical protein